MITVALLGSVLVLIGWALAVYNALVRLKVRSENAWSDIDVQLKRRYDLVPNLVATVQGYADHEKETLESVIAARTQAMNATGIAEKGLREDVLANTLRTLFAVAEQYPDLEANDSFLKLQTSLIEVEETLQSARRYYNAVVRDLNTLIQIFPQALVARMFHFQRRPFFQLTDPQIERESPPVKFGEKA